MKAMIENLINGNLTDAKSQAKKYRRSRIYAYLMGQGWSHTRAILAANYLKTGEGWQAYCDAK